ncbi:MAG TPA: VOC family protein [Gemmatimonadaceae bacterium]
MAPDESPRRAAPAIPAASTAPEGTPAGVAPPGFRLPAATRVGRVRLQVADLDRSIAFYERVLGLRVLERSGDVATMGARGASSSADGQDRGGGDERGDDAVLVELHELAGARPVPRGGRLGLYHFAVLLPDRASLGRFVGHVASQRIAVGAADHLVSEALYLHDPDGLGIEVYADRPRAAWRSEGREITMTTAPLDVRDLAAAGGDAPWRGAPAGTVIGHVHLHVGDLRASEAFYHEALGLDKVVWSYPGALFLSAGGYHHHLGTNVWAPGATRPGADEARLLEWELVLPDRRSLDAAAHSLAGGGHDITRAARGDVVASDPWGTPLRLVEGARASGAA